jgi:hypothetical protein
MPFNSQSPLIQGLNDLFSDPKAKKLDSKKLTEESDILTQRAVAHGLAPTEPEKQHILAWPEDHQKLLRGVFLLSIDENLPVSFAWEEATVTRTIIVSFGNKMGATFRSPYYTTKLMSK